ncbi:MAG TPA: methyltransferase domain-containing protein [Gemmatimonadaceae bacterium]|nr:methyltransferase domain-containing protein [Gemmatimonadaceae bacterium]
MSPQPALDWWASYFNDDYLLEHHPMFTERRNRREAGRALDVLGLPVGARVLDVPCGQGRHARLFAGAGMHVTGVDYSAHLLSHARAATRGSGVKYVRADMRRLPQSLSGKFDAVVSLGASFGFFATPAEDDATVASYARALVPGGQLVLHAANRDGVMARFIEKDWWRADDGTLVLHEREFDPVSAILTVYVVLQRRADSRQRAYRMRLYTASELAAMFARHGLTLTEACDGWRDAPLRRRSGEMLLVASRTH